MDDQEVVEDYTFGQWCQKRREARGLTRSKFAERCDISDGYVREIERDHNKPSVDVAQRLAVALRVDESDHDLFVRCARGAYMEVAKLPAADLLAPETTPETTPEAEVIVETAVPLDGSDPVGKKADWRLGVGVVLLGLLALAAVMVINRNDPPIWQEDFDPMSQRWRETSARWERIGNGAAVLVQDDPDDKFGKVESEPITADIDRYPILHVVVSAGDLDSSYEIQLVNLDSNAEKVVLSAKTGPGEYWVNVADEMGWSGSHSFTINLWISGEGKSATFDLISLQAAD